MAIVSSSIAVHSYDQPACRQTSHGLDANPLASPESVEALPDAAAPLQKRQTSDGRVANPFASPENVEALPEAAAPLQKDESADSKMPNPLPAELPLPAKGTSTKGPERASQDKVPTTTTPAATEPKSAPDAPRPTSATPAIEPESAPFIEPNASDDASRGRPIPINHVVRTRREGSIEPGQQVINDGNAGDVVGSTVSFVDGSIHARSDSRGSSPTPAASHVKSVDAQGPASATKSANASPTNSVAAPETPASPVTEHRDDSSPMLTPRARAASAVLFGF